LLDGIIKDGFLTPKQLRITIRDNAFKMDVPASANAYGGTGTTDGDCGLTGKRKPLAYGVVNNVTPAQINATNLVYQVHDGAVNAIPPSTISVTRFRRRERSDRMRTMPAMRR
jgi:hypothetical protein